MRTCAIALVLLTLAVPAAGDFVCERWGNTAECHHRSTLKVSGKVVEFDLSALGRMSRIQRAVVRAPIRRSDYRSAIEIHPLGADRKEPDSGARPLALIGPWYRTFDATDALRAWAKRSEGGFRLYFESAPGWRREATMLEIAYQVGRRRRRENTAKVTPRVADLRAVHLNGQTFLTWQEHEDIMAGEEPVTIEKMEKKLLPLRGKKDFVYRVYAHDRLITLRSIADAQLVAEVPFVLSAYYLDSIRTIEHPHPDKGEGRTPLVGGARAKRDPVPRYVIRKGEEPPARGYGLYVRTITKPGKTYYAVVTALNGREAVDVLNGGNSLLEAVDEKVAPPGPVWQSQTVRKPDDRRPLPWVVGRYNFWLEFPYVNVPRQLQVAIGHPQQIDPRRELPLYVHLGAYGGQPAFYCRQGGGYQVMLCPPYDQDDSMFQGRHECLGTLKSYDQGVVHNWAQRRTFALMDWAVRQWPIDTERTTLRGQFCCWALRYPERFTSVLGDGYGNNNKGREAQKHGPLWGPYPEGSRNWTGVDHWEWMNLCKYIRENPTKELPYYVSFPYSASHVGDIGPWPWPELYRALHDTKRAFCARWGNCWAGAPPAIAMAERIKMHQSLPAFADCSLDDNPGDGASDPGSAGADGDPTGNINGYLFWDTDSIVDEANRWGMTIWLYEGDRHGRGKAPADACTVSLTPRRCRKFRARPGQQFRWTSTSVEGGRGVQSGTAAADKWGLVTIEKLIITTGKNRIRIGR
jgi:hypothetical protein